MATKKTDTKAVKAAEKEAEVKAAPAAEKPVEKKAAEKKAPAKKAPAKKAPAKKTEVKTTVTVEFGGKAVKAQDVLAKVKKAVGRSAVKTLEIYMNVDEQKAYYVVNGEGGPDKYVEL